MAIWGSIWKKISGFNNFGMYAQRDILLNIDIISVKRYKYRRHIGRRNTRRQPHAKISMLCPNRFSRLGKIEKHLACGWRGPRTRTVTITSFTSMKQGSLELGVGANSWVIATNHTVKPTCYESFNLRLPGEYSHSDLTVTPPNHTYRYGRTRFDVTTASGQCPKFMATCRSTV